MDIKVGDKVKIINVPYKEDSPSFVPDMKSYLGKVVRVENVLEDRFAATLVFDHEYWYFPYSAIACKVGDNK